MYGWNWKATQSSSDDRFSNTPEPLRRGALLFRPICFQLHTATAPEASFTPNAPNHRRHVGCDCPATAIRAACLLSCRFVEWGAIMYTLANIDLSNRSGVVVSELPPDEMDSRADAGRKAGGQAG